MPERVGVIGAGPAGLAAAYRLSRLGRQVEIFEAGPGVGGMARTFELWGQKVDLGPHRFYSSDARVNRLWLEVVGDDYRMVDRLTRIFYGGELFGYPLRLADSVSRLGVVEGTRCLLSYLSEQLRPGRPAEHFEGWVRRRFGKRLYEIFFKSYSEKLWGISCDRLDADFAAQRIRKLSLLEAVRGALVGGRGNRHATLVDRFAYPLGGTGSVYSRMADLICSSGGKLHLDSPVARVEGLPDGRVAVELSTGIRREYDHVISTMPLTTLVEAMPDVPSSVLSSARSLRFRNTIVVYLRVPRQDLFEDQWVYVHDPELEVGRITNYSNWVPELCQGSTDSILSLEMWCNPGDEQWLQPDAVHVERAISDLRRTGLIGEAEITDQCVYRVPKCYPVYDLGYREHVAVLKDYLSRFPGLQPIGRAGAFRYNNQDHSLLMGMLAAENLAEGGENDLWEVNSDDTYQEEAFIDETGLVESLG